MHTATTAGQRQVPKASDSARWSNSTKGNPLGVIPPLIPVCHFIYLNRLLVSVCNMSTNRLQSEFWGFHHVCNRLVILLFVSVFTRYYRCFSRVNAFLSIPHPCQHIFLRMSMIPFRCHDCSITKSTIEGQDENRMSPNVVNLRIHDRLVIKLYRLQHSTRLNCKLLIYPPVFTGERTPIVVAHLSALVNLFCTSRSTLPGSQSLHFRNT
jgi:hypothetical protein